MALGVLTHPLVVRADEFATAAHASIGQLQPYTGRPYCAHTRAVAELLVRYVDDPALVAAGHLHDVMEDVKVPRTVLEDLFGTDVVELVEQVTTPAAPQATNRRGKAQAEALRFAAVSSRARTLKSADVDINVSSIVERAPSFARVYVPEKRLLLQSLRGAHPGLLARVELTIATAESELRRLFGQRARP